MFSETLWVSWKEFNNKEKMRNGQKMKECTEGVIQRCSVKKDVLKNFAKSTG